jgi:hypothetical protein
MLGRRRLTLLLLVVGMSALVACADKSPCSCGSPVSGSSHTSESASGWLRFEPSSTDVIEAHVGGDGALPRLTISNGELSVEDVVDVTHTTHCDAGATDGGDPVESGVDDASDAEPLDGDAEADASDSDAADAGDAGVEAGCEAGLVTSREPGTRLKVRYRKPSDEGVYALSALGAVATYCPAGYLTGYAGDPPYYCGLGGGAVPVEEPLEGTLSVVGSSYTLDVPKTAGSRVSIHIEVTSSSYQGPDECY